VSALVGYETGTLAPIIKCVRCNSQARLMVENSLMAGLGFEGTCAVCVDHAIAIAREIGDSLGALMISDKYRSL